MGMRTFSIQELRIRIMLERPVNARDENDIKRVLLQPLVRKITHEKPYVTLKVISDFIVIPIIFRYWPIRLFQHLR